LEAQTWADPGEDQVLIRTERSLISTGTELTALSGEFPAEGAWANYIRYPVGCGYSNVGTVVRVGAGVDRVAVGDRVTSWAAHATYGLRGQGQVWRVPPEVDSEAASFATLAEIVMGGLRRSRLSFGESVVIVGAGLLGQLCAHFCRAAGAWPVLVVDTAEARLGVAQRMGAHATIAGTSASAIERVKALTAGRLADVVFEITGNPLAFPGAVKLARRLGRVVLLGSPRGPVTLDLHDEVHTLGLEIIGAHNSTHPPVESPNSPWTIGRHTELFLAWQAEGAVDVRPLISHRFPWQDSPEAFRMLLTDRSGALGVVLDWSAAPEIP
jgi:2-desacetyl-2-hydroxyethyl bacteriochlorophyllide A dehydrogenase